MSTVAVGYQHAPAWLSAATADKLMAWSVVGAVLLVIILLARANGRLAKLARVAAAPVAAPKSSGGGGKLLLLAALGAGGWLWYESKHKIAATAVKAAPPASPSPSPRPTVTQTVAPHITNFHFPLTGGDIVAMWIIGGAVAIVLVGAVLRRSS